MEPECSAPPFPYHRKTATQASRQHQSKQQWKSAPESAALALQWMAYPRDGRSRSCEIGRLWLMATPAQAGRYRDADRPHMCFASYDLTRTSGQALCKEAQMYGCYVFESRHGAARTRCSIYERLGKIAQIVVQGTSPICLGTLVGTRLPIGGTTLGRRTPTPATTQGDPGLARSPFHPAHRALHRAIADAVQGLLALIVT
jgi:hypothetical protein